MTSSSRPYLLRYVRLKLIVHVFFSKSFNVCVLTFFTSVSVCIYSMVCCYSFPQRWPTRVTRRTPSASRESWLARTFHHNVWMCSPPQTPPQSQRHIPFTCSQPRTALHQPSERWSISVPPRSPPQRSWTRWSRASWFSLTSTHLSQMNNNILPYFWRYVRF